MANCETSIHSEIGATNKTVKPHWMWSTLQSRKYIYSNTFPSKQVSKEKKPLSIIVQKRYQTTT